MPEYLHPGVYIEEIERGPRPIEGVPTSTAAFLGEAERGPIKPTLVTSYKEYERWFGSVFAIDPFLPYAVSGFFENGGKRVFVCRLVGQGATSAQAAFGGNFTLRAAGPGSWGRRVFAKVTPSTTQAPDAQRVTRLIGFRIRLAYWSSTPADFDVFDPFEDTKTLPRPRYTEDFDDLVAEESSPDFYGKRFPLIDLAKGEVREGPDSSALAVLVRSAATPDRAIPDPGAIALTEGGEDDATPIGPDDFDGLPDGMRTEVQGLAALELDPYRDVAVVHAPNAGPDSLLKIIGPREHALPLRGARQSEVWPAGQPRPAHDAHRLAVRGVYYAWIFISDPHRRAQAGAPRRPHTRGLRPDGLRSRRFQVPGKRDPARRARSRG